MASEAPHQHKFHPAVQSWLEASFEGPTPAQHRAWPLIQSRKDVLVAAPTGSGKTLCAFLAAIDELVRESLEGQLAEETRVLYVSPLKALSNDIERNLQVPLDGISRSLAHSDRPAHGITTAVRTGDTPAKDRARHTKHPAHIYVTTPESLYILLTSEGGRKMLETVQTVIIDEVHAVVRDKRGAHLALSLERLDELLKERGNQRAQRIGLSATQKPIEQVARFLAGFDEATQAPHPCEIVDTGHQRALDLSLCIPGSPLEAVMSAECWAETYDQLANLVQAHTTTLIFTNTRRLAERITRFLAERVGEKHVTSHHGSLSRARRHAAEQALKEGRLKALVATASLELGIDVGDVDLVCQVGSPGSIATLLQRVGRSGHFVGGMPKGRLFPLSRDDLVESVALLQAVRGGELDAVSVPYCPLDILAQQLVATVVPGEKSEEELFSLVRRAAPFSNLSRERFDSVVHMLSEGYSTSRGRRGAYLHHDGIGHRIKARRAARLTAITNGGAIPDNFDYEVMLEPSNTKLGTVHEDFAIESIPGDIFQLGNTSYQIIKVEPGVLRVADAHGQPPSIPFWIGEAPSRTDELSRAVSRLRSEVANSADAAELVVESLTNTLQIPKASSRQLVEYLLATHSALGHMPTQQKIVVERFFDETGGMHVVLHSPFGSRINRAFGLALRKRFCRSFNVELQAAAGEDALILSLGPMHSFPLDSIFEFLNAKTVRTVLTQALLDAPLFQTRWRWNASRALAVLRFRGGKKVPPRFQRMESDDLLALCFPDQVACLENIAGDRQVPDHPLVEQTIDDSLNEAMDVAGLEALLRKIANQDVVCVARDLTEPSPLAHEILSARPYAFLDDAPLEERRTQAVQTRRFNDPKSASDLGDLNPEAITQVVSDARPRPRDADELHDALLVHLALPEEEAPWSSLLDELVAAGRVYRLRTPSGSLWFAAERSALLLVAHPAAEFFPTLPTTDEVTTRESALIELVRGRMEMVGPTSVRELSAALSLSETDVLASLTALEIQGFVIRGNFRTDHADEEFCERRLLARIHRLTIGQLRREIEPVSPSVYFDFLTHYQGLQPEGLREGVFGTLAVLEQLTGFSAAAGCWESDVLPARVKHYSPGHLDQLCQGGQVTWGASRRTYTEKPNSQLIRATPLCIVPRLDAELWLRHAEGENWSSDARRMAQALQQGGARFFSDLRRETGLLASQAERAVGELISLGLVTCDSFAGLRTLLLPENKRRDRPSSTRRRQRRGPVGLDNAGRLSWLPSLSASSAELASEDMDELARLNDEEERVEDVAWALLARYGIVFRKVLERETGIPSWGELLRVYHRLEARGELRGGRFVTRFSGEQFATNEALTLLRQVRRVGPSQTVLRINACDPLNLVGILTPDQKLPAKSSNRFLLRGGIVQGLQVGNEILTTSKEGEDESQLDERAVRRAFRAHGALVPENVLASSASELSQ